jgi:hypothetical protein
MAQTEQHGRACRRLRTSSIDVLDERSGNELRVAKEQDLLASPKEQGLLAKELKVALLEAFVAPAKLQRPSFEESSLGNATSTRTVSGATGETMQKELMKMLHQQQKEAKKKKRFLFERMQDSVAENFTPFANIYFPLFILFFLFNDFMCGGLGSSNGRFTSFVDSLNSVFSFRAATMGDVPKRLNLLDMKRNTQRLHVLLMTSILKFAPGTLVSLALSQTPVVLKGPRECCCLNSSAKLM